MATIIRETLITTDLASSWDALSDFGALHTRLAAGFVLDTQLERPDERLVTFTNGAVVRERLVGIDANAHRLAYTVIESGFNLSHYNGAAQIVDTGDGQIQFVWTIDVLPDELAEPIAAMMDEGIRCIKQTLERATVHR
jgi:Polyketide cyclase / dehydrase and lipid transport